ncbi:MAG: O-GlcNAc transferase, partial [Thermodesulfobacteriota bacterium]
MNGEKGLRALAVVALCLLIYWPSLKNGYIWDDDQYVYHNPAVTQPGGINDIWLTHNMPQYYPLVFTLFRLEHMTWGDAPAGYHAVNMVLHMANALMLMAVLALVAPAVSFAAALLFAVHPIQVETVAWITERKNLLALFFLLSASLFYLRFYRTSRPGNGFAAFLFYLCALLSKSAAAWFAIVPMVHAWWATGRVTRKDLVLGLPFLLTGAAAGLHTAWLEATKVGAAGETWNLDILAHILLASRISVFYLYKALVPLEFVFFYPRWSISPTAWWQWIFPVMVIGAIIGAILTRGQTRRAGPALLLLYGAALFPVLGFFSVYPMRFSYVADHFAYLASPVIFLAIGASAGIAWSKIRVRFSAHGRTATIAKWSGRCAAVLVITLLSVKSASLVNNY